MNPFPDRLLNAAALPSESDIDRRTQPDRRQSATSLWGAFRPAGRREKNRRVAEHRRSYFVDRFSPTTFIFVVLLVAASITDAVLTIHLLRAGAREINPLMGHCLRHGIQPFLAVKYALTVGGLPLLLIFQNHYLFGTRLRVRYLIPMAVTLYAVLIGYQVVLMHKHLVF